MATLPLAAQPSNVIYTSTGSSSNHPRSNYDVVPAQHAHIAPQLTNYNTSTIITVQGPGPNEIPYLEELTLPAVIAFKFNIDEARQRHPASAVYYASNTKKDITLKLQTFVSWQQWPLYEVLRPLGELLF